MANQVFYLVLITSGLSSMLGTFGATSDTKRDKQEYYTSDSQEDKQEHYRRNPYKTEDDNVVDTLPDYYRNNFDCSKHQYAFGMYADMDFQCQVYHICHHNRKETFLCPKGTLFNQRLLVCDHWYSVKCAETPTYYYVNEDFGKPSNRTGYQDYSRRRFQPGSRPQSPTQTSWHRQTESGFPGQQFPAGRDSVQSQYHPSTGPEGTRYGSHDTSEGTRYGSQDTSQGTRYGTRGTSTGTRYGSQDTSQGTRHGSQDTSRGTRYGTQGASVGTRYGSQDTPRGTRYGSQGTSIGTRYGSQDTSQGTRYGNQGTPQDISVATRYGSQDTSVGTRYGNQGTPQGRRDGTQGTPTGTRYGSQDIPQGTRYGGEGNSIGTRYGNQDSPQGTIYGNQGTPQETRYGSHDTSLGTRYGIQGIPQGTRYGSQDTPQGTRYGNSVGTSHGSQDTAQETRYGSQDISQTRYGSQNTLTGSQGGQYDGRSDSSSRHQGTLPGRQQPGPGSRSPHSQSSSGQGSQGFQFNHQGFPTTSHRSEFGPGPGRREPEMRRSQFEGHYSSNSSQDNQYWRQQQTTTGSQPFQFGNRDLTNRIQSTHPSPSFTGSQSGRKDASSGHIQFGPGRNQPQGSQSSIHRSQNTEYGTKHQSGSQDPSRPQSTFPGWQSGQGDSSTGFEGRHPSPPRSQGPPISSQFGKPQSFVGSIQAQHPPGSQGYNWVQTSRRRLDSLDTHRTGRNYIIGTSGGHEHTFGTSGNETQPGVQREGDLKPILVYQQHIPVNISETRTGNATEIKTNQEIPAYKIYYVKEDQINPQKGA